MTRQRPQRKTWCPYCRKGNHDKQIVEVQEMVDETIRDRSLYDPQALAYFFKILTDVSQDNNPDGDDEGEDNIVHLPSYIQLNPPLVPFVVPVPKVLPKSRQPRPTVTEIFNVYYDKSAEEPLESIAFGSKEEERETELEVFLQNLVAEYEAVTKKKAEKKNNDLPNDRIKVARIGGTEETYPVGPYCEEVGVKEVKEKKEIEVEKKEAGVEKDEEKKVEVKREEKEETKEEKREKYEENVLARIGKIVDETEDEDDNNEADEDEEDNDDDNETIVDEEDDEKKEDIEELTKKSKDLDYACKSWIKKVEGFRNGNSKEQFDPGGFDRSGIIVEKDLKKANEKWKKKVRVFLDENEGDFDENKREEFVPPRVLTFDAAPSQVVEVRSLIMLDEIVNNITWSEPIEITPMPPPYNDSHDLANRVSLTCPLLTRSIRLWERINILVYSYYLETIFARVTPVQKRLLHEMVTPYYYTVTLKIYDIFVVVRMDQIYRTTRVIYQDLRVLSIDDIKR
ncbi:19458_t:CDS:2, partial [Racocetra persica]